MNDVESVYCVSSRQHGLWSVPLSRSGGVRWEEGPGVRAPGGGATRGTSARGPRRADREFPPFRTEATWTHAKPPPPREVFGRPPYGAAENGLSIWKYGVSVPSRCIDRLVTHS